MKIRGHGNGLAIALSAVAVVFAASGTAYAVSGTLVNIADPSTPSRVAKVDPAGRLSTVGAASTIDIAQIGHAGNDSSGDVFSAPTTATLAVTKFSVTSLGPLSGVWNAYLFQVPALADGTCSLTTTVRSLGYGTVVAGQLGGQDFDAPIIVAPVAGAKYCLDVYYRLASGTPAGGESFGVQLTGYVTVGRYIAAPGAPDAASGAAVSKSVAVGGR